MDHAEYFTFTVFPVERFEVEELFFNNTKIAKLVIYLRHKAGQEWGRPQLRVPESKTPEFLFYLASEMVGLYVQGIICIAKWKTGG